MRPPVSSPSRILATQSHTQSGRSGRGDALRLARGIRRRNKPKTIPHSPAAHGRASGEATSRRSGRLCVPSVFHPHPANPVILSRKRCPPRNIAPHAERTAKGEAPPAGILSSGGDDKFWSHPRKRSDLRKRADSFAARRGGATAFSAMRPGGALSFRAIEETFRSARPAPSFAPSASTRRPGGIDAQGLLSSGGQGKN